MGIGFIVNSDAKQTACHEWIDKLAVEHKYFSLEAHFGEDQPNTWSMKKTWRMWMSQTAKWMASNGAKMPLIIKRDGSLHGLRPFNAQDAHELWISTWLGVDANGERYKTASGDKGTMLLMMEKHLAWATERGVKLTIPKNSEFNKLRSEN